MTWVKAAIRRWRQKPQHRRDRRASNIHATRKARQEADAGRYKGSDASSF